MPSWQQAGARAVFDSMSQPPEPESSVQPRARQCRARSDVNAVRLSKITAPQHDPEEFWVSGGLLIDP